LQNLKKPKGGSTWAHVSQFSDEKVLTQQLTLCLKSNGSDLDLATVEAHAPKWAAAAEDLISDSVLRGRTAVYPGVPYRKEYDDNKYLLLFAFYLQKKLAPEVKKAFEGKVERHQLVTLEDTLVGTPVERTGGPAIYIIADASEDKDFTAAEAEEMTQKMESAREKRHPPPLRCFCMLSEPSACEAPNTTGTNPGRSAQEDRRQSRRRPRTRSSFWQRGATKRWTCLVRAMASSSPPCPKASGSRRRGESSAPVASRNCRTKLHCGE